MPYLLCLGNLSKDFRVDNKIKTGLTGCVYDYLIIRLLQMIIPGIHNCLM